MINRRKIQEEDDKIQEGAKIQEEDKKDFDVKIEVKINEKLIVADVDDALYIPTVDKLNPTYLSNMMAENPRVHARWNVLYNESVYDYDIKKTKLEVWMAKQGLMVRKELAKVEKGRITDKLVEDTIKIDPEFERLNDDLAIAKKNMKHIFALSAGFGDKGEKLISIASLMKWEGENFERGSKKKYEHIRNEPRKKEAEVADGWSTH
jgi:hypothetical protein